MYPKYIVIKITNLLNNGRVISNLKKYIKRYRMYFFIVDTKIGWDYREYTITIHNDIDYKYTQMLINYLDKRKFVYEWTD